MLQGLSGSKDDILNNFYIFHFTQKCHTVICYTLSCSVKTFSGGPHETIRKEI